MKNLDYFQADFYTFSEDSINLAKYVASLKFDNELNVLDLCAGTGIVGIEFANRYDGKIKTLSFCEYQNEFEDIIKKNIENFLIPDIETYIYMQNFVNLDMKFDLILANPPYYNKNKGKIPKDIRRAKCKFFMDSDFDDFILFLEKNLNKKGCAYFLSKDVISSSKHHLVHRISGGYIYKLSC